MTFQQILDNLSTANIIAISIGALTILLYLISKLVYVEKGIVPLGIKAINSFFDLVFSEVKYFGGFLFGYTKEELDEFLANESLLKGMSNTITGVAVLLVIFSFLASYSASRDFVITRGISPSIAFAIPLGIDGFIVLLVLFITYQSLKGEGTVFGRVFLFVFTALSIYFNISHLEADVSSWTLALTTAGAIAPSIVFIGVEVVSSVQRAQVLRNGLVLTDSQLRERVQEYRSEIAGAQSATEEALRNKEEAEVKRLEQEALLAKLDIDITYMAETLAKLDEQFGESLPQGVKRLDQVKTLMQQGLDADQVAIELNIKQGTVRHYIRQLNGSV